MKFVNLCESLIREYRWLGKKRKTVNEDNSTGGSGSVFGPNATGEHGGDVSNTDWYAPGDTRRPGVIGITRRLKNKKRRIHNTK